MDIKGIANDLSQKYETRDPFALAASLGIAVLFEPLGEIQGYYNKCYRHQFIHINQDLGGYDAAFTCGHELGHAVLHTDVNTPFLRRHTLFSVNRLETQANRFALDLLYADEELRDFLDRPITDAAAYMGVPLPLAEYRMWTAARAC